MKSIVTEGTIEKAPCENCRRFVQATYAYGPVEVDGLVVEDVMRATCNECGLVVATTPQSAHRFKIATEDRHLRFDTAQSSDRELDPGKSSSSRPREASECQRHFGHR